ncbi:hypothetical protein ACWCOW_30365 [Streptomyces sp. NPDC001939]
MSWWCFGISRQAFYTWFRRYRPAASTACAPAPSPNASHVEVVGEIIYLRQDDHFGPEKISMYLQRRYHDVTISASGRTAWTPPFTP